MTKNLLGALKRRQRYVPKPPTVKPSAFDRVPKGEWTDRYVDAFIAKRHLKK
jgi:hypothetical protein